LIRNFSISDDSIDTESIDGDISTKVAFEITFGGSDIVV